MLLLHVSDIHFRAPDCLNPDLDSERPYRTRLLQDARARVADRGVSVGALLVGGDIAYKGHPEEYAAATQWLKELAEATGCPLSRIFVVPGNHDIDRAVVLQSQDVRDSQNFIADANPDMRERALRNQFNDLNAGAALLAPLAAYNEFAKFFNCQIYAPTHLYWKQDLVLEEGVHLRIYGLTSTILSGADGQDDRRGGLYLSPLQTVLDPVEDVVNLVMCHHPPDWLMDQDEVVDAICGRAAIHLFGHQHRQRILRDSNYVRYSAGAVNPDRNEAGWEPGYNLIDVRVVGTGPQRVLHVDAQLLHWQTSPELFRPKLASPGQETFYHCISIPGRIQPVAPEVKSTPTVAAASIKFGAADAEAAMSEESNRDLIFRFWNLSGSQRREIAFKLGLIDQDEMRLPEPARYGRALLRAAQRGLIDQLALEINQREI